MQLFRPFTATVVLALATLAFAAPVPAPQNLASSGRPPAARTTPLERYYFKEPLPLVLDTEHVGVRAPAGIDPARLPSALDPAGIEELAAAGWRLIRLREPVTPESIDALLEQLAAAPDFDFVSPVFRDEFGPHLVTPQILIRFESSIERTNAELVLENAVPGAVFEVDWAGMSGAYRVQTSERNGLKLLDTANKLARRMDVEFAEPDFLFTARVAAQDPPTDPMFAFSWSLYSPGTLIFDTDFDIGILGAWAVTQGDPGVRVLVLDAGIEPDHPDLNQDPGEDFTGEGTGGAPGNTCDNHGTIVAGCISAFADNGLGSAGVAPQCKVVSARVLVHSCDAYEVQPSWVVDALHWGITHGIRITNTSFLMDESSALSAKYQSTHDQGVVHFAASGNGGVSQVEYPAKAPGVIAIGATSFDGHRAWISNYGANLDFVAPGDLIRTTDRSGINGWSLTGDYVIAPGTSLASAIAAGVAALLRSVDPSLTPAEIEQILKSSARDLESAGWDQFTGWGMIRADRALAALAGLAGPEEFHTCDSPSFSARGHSMVFASYSPDLVPGDTNGKRDVFVRSIPTVSGDTMAGTVGPATGGSPGVPASVGSGDLSVGTHLAGIVGLVSVSSSGLQGDNDSRHPSVSADGRYIAFESWAANLVDRDNNLCRDVFVRDVLLGTTERVSVSSGGIEADGESKGAMISADGRYVAFASNATNLDPAASSGVSQVYLHDMWTGTTTLLSKTSEGVAGNKESLAPSISGNGQRVAFVTLADNLVDSNGWPNVLLADLPTATLTLVNVDSSGQSAPGMSSGPVISRDGNRIAFTTESALAPGDTNGLFDVYVRNLVGWTTLAGSADAGGAFGSRESHAGALSRNGRFLVFTSAAWSFDPGDTNEHVDVFRKDLVNGAVVRVSVGAFGQQATAGCGHPCISPDGFLVGFTSRDDALTPGDEFDGAADVYLRNVPEGTTELLTPGS
jgi:subtilisin family serine protease/Tol biopolymer transport system component